MTGCTLWIVEDLGSTEEERRDVAHFLAGAGGEVMGGDGDGTTPPDFDGIIRRIGVVSACGVAGEWLRAGRVLGEIERAGKGGTRSLAVVGLDRAAAKEDWRLVGRGGTDVALPKNDWLADAREYAIMGAIVGALGIPAVLTAHGPGVENVRKTPAWGLRGLP